MAGATYDIIVLSSSPPDSRHVAPRAHSPASPLERRVAMASSPPRFLSPPPLPNRATVGASLSGSRAAPVPIGVERGFATARSLLADISIDDRGLSAIEEALESRRAPTGPQNTIKASRPPRKRAPKAAATGEDAAKPKAKPKPRGRKPKITGVGQAPGDAHIAGVTTTTSAYFAQLPAGDAAAATHELATTTPEPKPTKPRKPRTKKAATDDGEAQTTIKKARVTKPRGATKAPKKAREQAVEVASAHFRTRGVDDDAAAPHRRGTPSAGVQGAGGQSALTGDASLWDVPSSPSARSHGPPKQRPPNSDYPLDLDEAVSRRRDWTPATETERQEFLTSSTGKENRPVPETESFTTRLSAYSYGCMDFETEPSASRSTSTEVAGATKRRRMEVSYTPTRGGHSLMIAIVAGSPQQSKSITSSIPGEGEGTQKEASNDHRPGHRPICASAAAGSFT